MIHHASLGYPGSLRWQHFSEPSHPPGENMGLHFRAARAALPQIRVDTLICAQANYEIKLK